MEWANLVMWYMRELGEVGQHCHVVYVALATAVPQPRPSGGPLSLSGFTNCTFGLCVCCAGPGCGMQAAIFSFTSGTAHSPVHSTCFRTYRDWYTECMAVRLWFTSEYLFIQLIAIAFKRILIESTNELLISEVLDGIFGFDDSALPVVLSSGLLDVMSSLSFGLHQQVSHCISLTCHLKDC